MRVIYEALKQRILDKTGVQDVRLFSNQLQHMETGKATLYLPSVLVEFSDVTYGHKNQLNQYGKATVKIYIVTEDYKDTPEEAFELWEDVDRCLNRYSDSVNFYPLERTGETHDRDFSNVYVYVISYEMNFIHYLTPETPADVTTTLVDLQITKGETTVVVPTQTKPAKVVNPNTGEAIYLDRDEVYEVALEPEVYTVSVATTSKVKLIRPGLKGIKLSEYGGQIAGYTITSKSTGNIRFDITKNGASICGASKPTLTNQQFITVKNVLDWNDTTIEQGDEIGFIVESADIRDCLITLMIKVKE